MSASIGATNVKTYNTQPKHLQVKHAHSYSLVLTLINSIDMCIYFMIIFAIDN